MIEILKEIEGYEGLYAVSDTGWVFSLKTTTSRREGELSQDTHTTGHKRVNLYDSTGRVKKKYVHRLVAQAFLNNPRKHRIINHKDADKTNNYVENLEWCTYKHNYAEAKKLGLHPKHFRTVATNITTKERRIFNTRKDCSRDIFGNPWSLEYPYKTKGNKFEIKGWRFEVVPHEF